MLLASSYATWLKNKNILLIRIPQYFAWPNLYSTYLKSSFCISERSSSIVCKPKWPPVILSRFAFSLRRKTYVTAAITTTQHRHMQLPTNPAWYSGPGEAPKISGPITFPTQYPTKVVALIVAFSASSQYSFTSQNVQHLLVCPATFEAAKETASPPAATCTAMRNIPANKRPLSLRGPTQHIIVPATEIKA